MLHVRAALMGAAATAAITFLPTAANAVAFDTLYGFTVDACTGGCGLSDYGTVRVQGDTDSSLTYTVSITPPAQLDPPEKTVDAFWFQLTGTGLSFSIDPSSNNTSNPGWTFNTPAAGSFIPNSGNFPGPYDYLITCTTNMAGHVCGDTLKFTATGTSMVVGSQPGHGVADGLAIYFVADVSNAGSTGLVGATFLRDNAPPPTVPVPGAAWLMGTVLGGAGFGAWRRRRRVRA